MRAVNGGPAKPTDKPPRPFQQGVGGQPTLVSNVETLANLPFILRHGGEAYRAVGTDASPGTFLATVTGAGRPAAALRAAARRAGHRPACAARSFARAGAGCADGRLLRRPARTAQCWTPRSTTRRMRGLGSGLGCGAVADPHRGLPRRRRRIGHGLLRPRERRPVRILLQRHRGDVRGHGGAARRGGHRRGPRPAGAVVGGAARPRRVRHPRRRHERRSEPAQAVPGDRRRHLAGECDCVPHRCVQRAAALRGGGARERPA